MAPGDPPHGERIRALEVEQRTIKDDVQVVFDEIKGVLQKIDELRSKLDHQSGADGFAMKVGYVVLIIGAAVVSSVSNILTDLFRHHP